MYSPFEILCTVPLKLIFSSGPWRPFLGEDERWFQGRVINFQFYSKFEIKLWRIVYSAEVGISDGANPIYARNGNLQRI